MKRIGILLVGMVLILGMAAGCAPMPAAAPAATPGETVADSPEPSPAETPAEPSETAPASASESSAAPTASTGGSAAAGVLSEDPFSFQISFDGQVIQLPCAASDLMAIGYSFEDRASDILETGYMTGSLMKLENGNYISTSVYNNSGEATPFTECKIDSIYVKDSVCEGQDIRISNGITFGASPEEIKAIYGEEADHVYESDGYLYLTYETEADFADNIKFSFKDNSLYEIDIQTREQ